jgi:hypothetical protein
MRPSTKLPTTHTKRLLQLVLPNMPAPGLLRVGESNIVSARRTYKTHAYEIHAYEIHAYEIHAYEIHAYEIHAYEIHAYEARL